MREQMVQQEGDTVKEPKDKRDHPIDETPTSTDPPPAQLGTPPRPPYGGPEGGGSASGRK
jgi:hypothetical protein